MAVDSLAQAPQAGVRVVVLFKSTAEPRRLVLAEGLSDETGRYEASRQDSGVCRRNVRRGHHRGIRTRPIRDEAHRAQVIGFADIRNSEFGIRNCHRTRAGRARGNDSRAVEVAGIRPVRRTACLASSREARSENRDVDGGGTLVLASASKKARCSLPPAPSSPHPLFIQHPPKTPTNAGKGLPSGVFFRIVTFGRGPLAQLAEQVTLNH